MKKRPEEMEENEIALLVQENDELEEALEALKVATAMFKAQKLYFKTRKQDDLVHAKRLETAFELRLADLPIAIRQRLPLL